MSTNLVTADDVEKAIKQLPGNLKVMVQFDGQYYPIDELKIRYVIPTTNWADDKCYIEVEEPEKGAIQIIAID